MTTFPDLSRLSPELRAQLDEQVRLSAQLLQGGCDLLERLSALNLRTARQVLDQALDSTRQLAACKDPMALGNLAMRRLQPAGELLRDYQRQVLGICGEVQLQMARPAGELWQAAGGAGARRAG